MKSLRDYILESDSSNDNSEVKSSENTQEKPETNTVSVTLEFEDIDGGAKKKSDIKGICTRNNLKFDDNNGVFKITLSSDKVDVAKEIASSLDNFIGSISDEEHEDIAEKLDGLSSALDKINEFVSKYGNKSEEEDVKESYYYDDNDDEFNKYVEFEEY